MSVVAVGAAAQPIRKQLVPIVYRKRRYSDDWELDLTLEPITATDCSACGGVQSFSFRRRYGPAELLPGETAFSARPQIDLAFHWVKLVLVGDEGETEIWRGYCEKQDRDLDGDSNGASGAQVFHAVGPDKILEKQEVYDSVWARGANIQTLTRTASFNLRGGRRDFVGNRSSTKFTPPGATNSRYLFGGTSVWTNYDALEYLVETYLNDRPDGPVWTIGGQIDILKARAANLPLPEVFTIRSALVALIDPRYGIDYRIGRTEDGFEITIFALATYPESFGGYSFPANPRAFRLEATSHNDIIVRVERSATNKYDKLVVVGARTKVVCSGAIFGTDFRALWSSTRESEYLAGAGGSDPDANDDYRNTDRFRDVFGAFGMVANWNFQDGDANPGIDAAGNFDSGIVLPYQTVERRTLPKLLLREGWVYTSTTPVNGNLSGVEADFLPPIVVCKDPDNSNKYFYVDKMTETRPDVPSFSVAALDNEWGVRLGGKNLHYFARGHWSGANASNIDPDALFDHEDLAFTIAIETDHRPALEYKLTDDETTGMDLVKVVEEPDAELWVLAPLTIVGITSAGALQTSPSTAVVLRNDAPALCAAMAGAIARYIRERMHVVCAARYLAAWGTLVGSILETVDDSGIEVTVGAPITTVEWNFKTMTTRVGTGFAR